MDSDQQVVDKALSLTRRLYNANMDGDQEQLLYRDVQRFRGGLGFKGLTLRHWARMRMLPGVRFWRGGEGEADLTWEGALHPADRTGYEPFARHAAVH